jgi:two-component system OmpR family response regulator
LRFDARELINHEGRRCELTNQEFRLLEVLVRHPQQVWTREQLIEQTRSLETDVFDRTIDVLILRLRRKIEPNPKLPQYICTERGQGYVFSAHVRSD